MRLDSLVPETRRSATVRLEVHLEAEELARTLRSDARSGLGRRPRQLPPKWFYDERGMELFEEITRLPEYYPTRREREILLRHAGDIARATRATLLVELGSGTSDKTRLLLSALRSEGTLRAFAPFDVSEPTLRRAALAIAGEHPGLHIHAVVGDFERHLGHLPGGSTRLIAFLGGTVGNLEPAARASFLRTLAHQMGPSDALLLGTDLVKDIPRLEAAYNDRRGVTAEFNRNVLRVLNRELGADFDIAGFEHRAVWNAAASRVEMHLVSRHHQRVRIPGARLAVEFEPGETIWTESSYKYRPAEIVHLLERAGFRVGRQWIDEPSAFALTLVQAV